MQQIDNILESNDFSIIFSVHLLVSRKQTQGNRI